MGYWGAGLFENDCSRDVLNELLAPWIKEIEELSGSSEATEWDGIAADELAIRMRILVLLHREKFPLESYPQPEILKTNRSAFEQGWRNYAGDNAFQNERLRNILEIWDEMVSVSEERR